MAYTFKHGDRILDGYTVQRAVGRGGFGEVYYAVSDGGREVALKYLRDNPEIELRGVNICMNLKSPHLVTIFDVRKAFDGNYVIIMEYISGPSLRDLLIAEPNGFSPEKAAFFVREIAKGLGYLHDRGIVHRDLKPGNIFYDDGYVKIGDYGLSKFISVSRHSAQTASVGTVHYMAPEIGSGDYSRGIDVYALGVMTYEMLKGRVPFEGSSMAEILMKHLTSQPELDQLPRPFGQVIRKALEKDPRNRYQTVSDMVDDLLSGEEIQRSLAGFSVQSLPGAVARAGGGAGSASPLPSPNPVPRGAPFGSPIPRAGSPTDMPMPKRVSKQQDRFEKKFERKMAKLRGQTPGAHHPPPVPPDGEMSPAARQSRIDRKKRLALGAFLAVALSVGLGIAFGNATDIGFAAGMAAALLVPTMAVGVGLARLATVWFATDTGPGWATKLVRAGCCTPLLALGNLPLFVDSPHGASAVAVWLALVLVSVLRNWDKMLDRAATGEMSFGSAVGSGIYAAIAFFIVSGAMDREPREELVALTAAVAGVASLIIQASSWWRFGAAAYTGSAGTGDGGATNAPSPSGFAFQGEFGKGDQRIAPGAGERGWDPSVTQTIGAGSRSQVPFAIPVGPASVEPMANRPDREFHPGPTLGTQADASTDALFHSHRAVRIRGFAMRGFWSLMTLALLGGVIATGIVAATVVDGSLQDQTGVLVGCVACAAMMLFTLRKTAPIRHAGFWREHVRTFVRSLALFGVGANLLVITRHWDAMADAPRVLSGIGLAGSSLAVLLTSLPRRSSTTAEAPFWRGSTASARMDAAPAASEETAR